MKDKQEAIYYMAGASKEEVERSPFVERLLKKGYEVLYLTEAVDEYCIGALPEFETKKFQNVAKEGLSLADGKSKEKLEETKKVFEPLTAWLGENALKDLVNHLAELRWIAFCLSYALRFLFLSLTCLSNLPFLSLSFNFLLSLTNFKISTYQT